MNSRGPRQITRRLLATAGLAAVLLGCGSIGVGVSLPIGGLGGIGVGASSDGSVSGGVGVGNGPVSVGVSGSSRFPARLEDKPGAAASAGAAEGAVTGASGAAAASAAAR